MALLFSHLYYFRFSKNVKIGIKCSIAVPDSPQNNDKTCLILSSFFYWFIYKLITPDNSSERIIKTNILKPCTSYFYYT